MKDRGAELKRLRTERRRLEDELMQKNDACRDASRDASNLAAQIRELDAKQQALLAEPTVSEHALLRWFERVQGCDRAAAVSAILSPATMKAIETLGTCEVPLGNGHRAIVKNKVVVTIE